MGKIAPFRPLPSSIANVSLDGKRPFAGGSDRACNVMRIPTGFRQSKGQRRMSGPLACSQSRSMQRGRGDVARREPHLKSADRTVVPKVRARLGRIVAGEYDGHRPSVGVNRLRVIYAATEEIGVVSRSVNGGRDPR